MKSNGYHLFAIITIFFWSLAYIFTRITIRYFSALSLGFLRYFVATFVLIIVAIVFKIKMPGKKDLKWFLLSGLSGFSLYVITFNKGCETVSASTSSIIIATVPVITALLARLIYKEKIRYLQYCAIIIEFSGVVILSMTNGIFTINVGIIWLLLAAFLLSIYNILQRKLTKEYTALQTTIYSIFCWRNFVVYIFAGGYK
jgi:drug/metabolite transporter (DMT)-like permease